MIKLVLVVACALIDLEFHSQPATATQNVRAFEAKEMAKIGMPEEIALRPRPTHFRISARRSC